MKAHLSAAILFSVLGISPVFAQNNFELVGPPSPPIVTIDEIPAVSQGATAMADIDNDGDQDILLSGFSITSQVISRLYVNNGIGGYTLKPSSFDQMYNGSIHFADVDGDNDMDVLITGMSNQRIAKLYLNDGLGNFTLDAGTPFQGVVYGSAAIADVNGDSAPDILVFGNSASGINTSLYLNNGTGGFTLAPGTPFEGVTYGQAAFADTDGDSDQDLVITGLTPSNASSTRYYVNDGNGIFTPAPTNIANVQRGTINFGDLDADNDMDALITGNTGTGITAQMYMNNGVGTFTLVAGTPFTAVHQGSVAFGDTDGDGDTDILLAGGGNSSVLARLYSNNGAGDFSTVAGTLFQGIAMGNAFLQDIDGDNDLDAFLIGGSGNSPSATFYTNDSGVFTPLIKSPFTGVLESTSAFADIDGDNDMDVLISGEDFSGSTVARLYTNDGNGNYTIVPGTPFVGVSSGAIGFSDTDSDGDMDVLITGYHINHSTANLYTNNGAGVFTLVAGTPFSPNQRGSLVFSDIDNDGDEDVLLTGYNGSYQSIAELYVNTAGNFTLVAGTPFIGLSYSKAAFSDLDGDNDQDLIINGYTGSFQPITQQFSNDGTGVFSAIANSSLLNLGMGSIAFGDIDGDNDMDLFLTGDDNTYNKNSKLYSNDGSGVFTELTSGITAFNQNNSAFTDVDSDGDLDLLIAGISNVHAVMLYKNNGTGIFTEVSGTPFKGVGFGSLSIADIDGNGKPDVLITGVNNNEAPSAFLYRNMNCTPTTSIAVHEACNAFTWIDGVNYTSSTSMPTWVLTNAEGCDSVVTLNLTITQPTTSTVSASACNSYDWHGTTYINSGAYSWTGTNAAGCDSVVTLNLTITQPTTGTVSASSCNSYDWHGTTYTNSGAYTWTGTNTAGCDSVVTLNLTIMQSTTGTVSASACNSYDWHGTTYTTSGAYSWMGTNAAGCDSLVTLNLTINQPTSSSVSATACGQYTWSLNSQTYTVSGAYTHVIPNSNNCDSTVTLNLTINQVDATVSVNGITLTANQSGATYQWIDCDNGNAAISGATAQSFTPSGNGSYAVLVTANGCTETSDCEPVSSVGIESLETVSWNIYPNPNNGVFTITSSQDLSGAAIDIYSSTGQLVYQTVLFGNEAAINLSGHPNGMYLVKINNYNNYRIVVTK
ncbi:MAG: Cadherin [Fluviicola sp.]|uniref:T9SS type A sorting domain-containing protein n=1 Tax=Fluviicola sp. TaxID=1917219 RepID=UPI00260A51AF|nr:T9SS type A sorting domain-containing protein [Fluviicola sp.]MDF3028299.1 Cadherin [Fluviicola sp.]